MQKRIVVVLVAILFIVVGLCGCNGFGSQSSEENRFVGTWKHKTYNYDNVFFSDGTGSWGMTQVSMVWELKDGKLVINTIQGLALAYDYIFSNNDTILELTSSNISLTFEKQ